MNQYEPDKIEKKWQKIWEKKRVFQAKKNQPKAGQPRAEKFYGLVEFPYPSGDGLHVGHLRSYTALDIICRKKRMQGYNVLYPIGFDSFGLPTENYAIKKKVSPKIITKKNIANFTRQLKSMGLSFDWDRSFSTSDPEYYKWTQWIFLKLFENNLAYKAKKEINWCTKCKIGLANEEVIGGVCERCGGEVIKKEKEQWILKITKYADRLIDDLKQVDYLDRIKEQQINWIGRSYGAVIKFQISPPKVDQSLTENSNSQEFLEVFTTRPDTIFGSTFLVIAPEHEFVASLLKVKSQKAKVKNIEKIKDYIKKAGRNSNKAGFDLDKTGIEIKGIKAINPATKKEIPILVADYVSMDYGTGAIMAVPGHDQRDFEFAKKYHLPIIKVVKPPEILPHSINSSAGIYGKIEEDVEFEFYEGEGVNINSGFLNGLETKEAIEKTIKWLKENNLGRKEVNYHLRDWIFSRQRYWGEPIPLIFCERCGWQPVPEKDLPVKLPEIKDFIPTNEGDSPLANIESFIKTKCPKCGGEAKRETDVMPNWAGSNWYYLRYCDPQNNKELADSAKLKYWMCASSRRSQNGKGGVDWYNGGMEHTTLHLLYSRFIYKFLYDIGAVPKECGPEPYKKRTAHGMILGESGIKMSKSKGNVINPDDYVKEYGADTVRMYEMFIGPFDQAIPWEGKSVVGIYRFLNRVWDLQEKIKKEVEDEKRVLKELHKTIKKVSEDIEEMKFNTAVSQLMICLNVFEKEKNISQDVYEKFLIILSPFAPHITEELYQFFRMQNGNKKLKIFKSIFEEKWPEYDEKLIKEDIFNLVIQVNGKVREMIEVPIGILEKEAKEKALSSSRIIGWTKDKEIKKVIFVKDKLINFVVK
ncbi:leucine--tRNA ligase [bacterium]|nr:MAG: leucine--tRNA ligase [bacterium]